MRAEITLRYAGPGVDSGRMDAYDAAMYIVAFSDFLAEVCRSAYGEKSALRTEVRGFEAGSFLVQFVLELGGVVSTLLSGPLGPKEVYDIAQHSFEAWKHLGGKDPEALTQIDDRSISITNNSGTVKIFRAETLNVITSEKAGQAAERFVKQALEGDIDQVQLMAGKRVVIADAKKEERDAFKTVVHERQLGEFVVPFALVIESAVFKDDNKWRFHDGQSAFAASIEDLDFLARVNNGTERFGKGDVLIADVRMTQSESLNRVKLERVIVKVHEHRIRSTQPGLFS